MIGILWRRGKLAGGNLADQALNSLGSLILTASFARVFETADFGIYAVLQLVLFSLATLHRVLLGSWVLTDSASEANRQRIASLITSVIFGLVSFGIFGIAYWLSAPPELVVGMMLQPFIFCVYDHARILEVRRSNYGWLVAYGALSLSGIITGFAIGVWLGDLEAKLATLGYVAGMFVAVFIHLARLNGLYCSISDLRAYVKIKSTDLRSQLVLAAGLLLPTALAPSLVAIASGAAAVAAVRGAQTLVSVPLQIPQGLRSLFLARYSDEVAAYGEVTRRTRRMFLLSQVVPIGLFAIVVSLIPPRLGMAVLGETWTAVEGILLFFLLASVFAQLSSGIDIYARANGILSKVALPLALGTVGVVSGIAIGAYFGGALGAGIASAICQCLRYIVCALFIRLP